MTAVNLVWGPIAGQVVAGGLTGFLVLDGTARRVASIFYAPKTGTINKIGVLIYALGGNPPPFNLGLVTLDASGNPTTTPAGGSAAESYDFVATGWHWITLSTPAAVTLGDPVAGMIWEGATPPDVTNNINLKSFYTQHHMGRRNVHHRYYTSSTWFEVVGIPAVAVGYDDGSVAVPGIWDADPLKAAEILIRSTTTPDEVGCIFYLPMAAHCVGAQVAVKCPTTEDFEVRLYDSGGSTVLASKTVDGGSFINNNTAEIVTVPFAGVNLLANTQYRLTVRALTSAADLSVHRPGLQAVGSRAWWPEGARWWQTIRTDLGSWTEYPLKLPMMGLLLDDITLLTTTIKTLAAASVG